MFTRSTQNIQWFGNGKLMQGVIRNSEIGFYVFKILCWEKWLKRSFYRFYPLRRCSLLNIETYSRDTIVKGVEYNRLNRSIALTRHSHSEWISIISLKIESQLSLIGNDLNLFNWNRNSLPEYTLPNRIHGFKWKISTGIIANSNEIKYRMFSSMYVVASLEIWFDRTGTWNINKSRVMMQENVLPVFIKLLLSKY